MPRSVNASPWVARAHFVNILGAAWAGLPGSRAAPICARRRRVGESGSLDRRTEGSGHDHRKQRPAHRRGHGASSHTADGTILLRFEQLKDIVIVGDVARVDAGVAWRGLNAALDSTGLTSLPGSNGDTTVVGFTINGGLSSAPDPLARLREITHRA
jgi:hypothetical protein